MSQVKIFGVREKLLPIRGKLSSVIHSCVMDALGMPEDKKAHRFIHLDKDDFVMPGGRSDAYTILEISMIEGRTVETKKKLHHFKKISYQLVDVFYLAFVFFEN